MNTTGRIYNIMGLSNTEKKIMAALSRSNNVQDLVEKTGISRTGIVYRLNTLAKRGLLHIVREGKKKTYSALDEKGLVDQLQLAVNEARASRVGQKGARIKTTKEDEFIIHVGAKEIIPAYERIAAENKDERIKAIQHHRSYNELLEKITPIQLAAFNKTIIKNRLIIEGMLNEGAYQAYKDEVKANPNKYKGSVERLEGRMADYTCFADDKFNYDAELWLFKNTSLLINWHDEVAIEITNRSMTAFLKDMFEFVKKDGQKIDHNQAVRNVLAR